MFQQLSDFDYVEMKYKMYQDQAMQSIELFKRIGTFGNDTLALIPATTNMHIRAKISQINHVIVEMGAGVYVSMVSRFY